MNSTKVRRPGGEVDKQYGEVINVDEDAEDAANSSIAVSSTTSNKDTDDRPGPGSLLFRSVSDSTDMGHYLTNLITSIIYDNNDEVGPGEGEGPATAGSLETNGTTSKSHNTDETLVDTPDQSQSVKTTSTTSKRKYSHISQDSSLDESDENRLVICEGDTSSGDTGVTLAPKKRFLAVHRHHSIDQDNGAPADSSVNPERSPSPVAVPRLRTGMDMVFNLRKCIDSIVDSKVIHDCVVSPRDASKKRVTLAEVEKECGADEVRYEAQRNIPDEQVDVQDLIPRDPNAPLDKIAALACHIPNRSHARKVEVIDLVDTSTTDVIDEVAKSATQQPALCDSRYMGNSVAVNTSTGAVPQKNESESRTSESRRTSVTQERVHLVQGQDCLSHPVPHQHVKPDHLRFIGHSQVHHTVGLHTGIRYNFPAPAAARHSSSNTGYTTPMDDHNIAGQPHSKYTEPGPRTLYSPSHMAHRNKDQMYYTSSSGAIHRIPDKYEVDSPTGNSLHKYNLGPPGMAFVPHNKHCHGHAGGDPRIGPHQLPSGVPIDMNLRYTHDAAVKHSSDGMLESRHSGELNRHGRNQADPRYHSHTHTDSPQRFAGGAYQQQGYPSDMLAHVKPRPQGQVTAPMPSGKHIIEGHGHGYPAAKHLDPQRQPMHNKPRRQLSHGSPGYLGITSSQTHTFPSRPNLVPAEKVTHHPHTLANTAQHPRTVGVNHLPHPKAASSQLSAQCGYTNVPPQSHPSNHHLAAGYHLQSSRDLIYEGNRGSASHILSENPLGNMFESEDSYQQGIMHPPDCGPRSPDSRFASVVPSHTKKANDESPLDLSVKVTTQERRSDGNESPLDLSVQKPELPYPRDTVGETARPDGPSYIPGRHPVPPVSNNLTQSEFKLQEMRRGPPALIHHGTLLPPSNTPLRHPQSASQARPDMRHAVRQTSQAALHQVPHTEMRPPMLPPMAPRSSTQEHRRSAFTERGYALSPARSWVQESSYTKEESGWVYSNTSSQMHSSPTPGAPAPLNKGKHPATLIGKHAPHDILYLKCNLCNQTYGNLHNFRKHFFKSHGFDPSPNDVIVRTISAARENEVCDIRIPPKQQLTPPLSPSVPVTYSKPSPLVSSVETPPLSSPTGVPSSESTWHGQNMQCFQCGMQFPTRDWGVFRRHMRLHEKLTLQCPTCFHPFQNEGSLGVHRARCTTTSRTCPHCSASFANDGALATHIREAHNQTTSNRHLTCPYCTQVFYNPNKLSAHVREHERALLSNTPASTNSIINRASPDSTNDVDIGKDKDGEKIGGRDQAIPAACQGVSLLDIMRQKIEEASHLLLKQCDGSSQSEETATLSSAQTAPVSSISMSETKNPPTNRDTTTTTTTTEEDSSKHEDAVAVEMPESTADAGMKPDAANSVPSVEEALGRLVARALRSTEPDDDHVTAQPPQILYVLDRIEEDLDCQHKEGKDTCKQPTDEAGNHNLSQCTLVSNETVINTDDSSLSKECDALQGSDETLSNKEQGSDYPIHEDVGHTKPEGNNDVTESETCTTASRCKSADIPHLDTQCHETSSVVTSEPCQVVSNTVPDTLPAEERQDDKRELLDNNPSIASADMRNDSSELTDKKRNLDQLADPPAAFPACSDPHEDTAAAALKNPADISSRTSGIPILASVSQQPEEVNDGTPVPDTTPMCQPRIPHTPADDPDKLNHHGEVPDDTLGGGRHGSPGAPGNEPAVDNATALKSPHTDVMTAPVSGADSACTPSNPVISRNASNDHTDVGCKSPPASSSLEASTHSDRVMPVRPPDASSLYTSPSRHLVGKKRWVAAHQEELSIAKKEKRNHSTETCVPEGAGHTVKDIGDPV